MKRIISVILSVLIVISFVPPVISNAATYTYDPDAAVSYAKAHYNDGKGLCAEFVSDCLKAGGFTAVYNVRAKDLGRQLQEYGTTITCSGWSSSSCLKASMFNGELSKGDVIIWENVSGSSSSGHAMLYSGKNNSKGQILVYAHNSVKNEEVIMPSSSASTVYAVHLASTNNTYSFDYNANGGTLGSSGAFSVKFGEQFEILNTTCTRPGYTFAGWNVKRNKDNKWYVEEKGWYTEGQISSNGFTKRVYSNNKTLAFDNSWINGISGDCTYTFYAIWESGCSDTHGYVSKVTAPNCTTQGYTTYTCSFCGHSYKGSYTNATGHSYQSTVISATCEEHEKLRYTCSKCGHIYYEYAGEYWSTVKPSGVADDKLQSKTQYRYSDYSTTTSYETSLPGYTQVSSAWEQTGTGNVSYAKSWPSGFDKGHSTYSTYNKSAKTASETATDKTTINSEKVTGYIYWHWCRGTYQNGPINRKTSDVKTSEFSAFHAFYSTSGPDGREPDGYGSVTYPNASCCKDTHWYYNIPVYTQTYTTYRKLFTYGKWGEWSQWGDAAYSATSTRKVETRIVYRYINAELGAHKYTQQVTAPTCSAQGYTTYTCSVCNDTYKGAYVAALGHNYTYNLSKTPTTSATGTLTGTCSRCSGTTTVTLPKLNTTDYTYAVKTAAGCTTTGVGQYTWKTTAYGTYKFDAVIAAVDHNYQNGYCTRCDAEDPDYNFVTAEVAVGTVSGEIGDTVTVPVSISNNPGIAGFTFVFDYDASAMTLTGISKGAVLQDGSFTPNVAGKTLNWFNAVNVTENGVLFNLTFKLSTTEGSYSVTAALKDGKNTNFVDENAKPQRITFITGKVNVANHSYTYKATKDPTTSATGTLTGTCSNCSGTTTVTLPKLNTTDYTYSVTKEPSYTETGIGSYVWKTTTYGTFKFDVTIAKLTATLNKIEVATNPTKTTYEIGEALNTSGLTLKVTYSDGSTKNITTGFTVSGFDSSTAGTKTVTVAYEGKTATFTVTVVKPTVDENAPQIIVSGAKGLAGDTVTVMITLKNNPGILNAVLTLNFDSGLELVKVEKGEALSDLVLTPPGVLKNGCNFLWDAMDEEDTSNGVMLQLTFKIPENAVAGTTYSVEFSYVNGDIADGDLKPVDMALVSGTIEVIDYRFGDVNNDGRINGTDVTLVRRYIAGGYNVEILTQAADVNKDGRINGTDVTLIRRYIAGGYGVELPFVS